MGVRRGGSYNVYKISQVDTWLVVCHLNYIIQMARKFNLA